MGRFVEEPDWHDRVMGIARDKQDTVSRDVWRDMRAGTPVDTGDLLFSERWVRVDDLTTQVGSDLDYSVYVEEGHEVVYRDRNTGEKVRTGRFVPPQRYMRPALFQERAL